MNQHQGIVHKVCGMYRRDIDDRKDLFQEIVIQLWKAFPNFRQEAKVSTWIYQIALNVAISDWRKENRRPEKTGISESIFNLTEIPADDAQEEKLQLLYHAIAQLSDVEKGMLVLYFEEKNNEEIAEILGITQNYVRVKMTRIREKLKSLMVPSEK
ncbi:RNA polymerase sigma factor [Pseudarcicella hirudinis]|uniref:RNA polymerase sigma factor n=1 Tax=Pseudarcicella hirudinis TaxID=1079859 RepID=UPI0021CF39BA|nr:sigma-70 family RNA polymerase sigma factor [Pseudarcicella hirudinis]